MSLDLAFAAELERAVTPPSIPSTTIEQPWRSDAAAHAQRESDRKLSASRLALKDWRDRVELVKSHLNKLPSSAWNDTLASMIELQTRRAEKVAEERAVKAARAEKDIDRVQKWLRQRDPSLAAVHRDTTRQAMSDQLAFINDLLEFALFLRSVQSGFSEDAQGGPTFSDLDKLEAYLEGAYRA